MRDRGEIALLDAIARLVPGGGDVLVGPGDDAAVLRRSRHPVLLTSDALVEGVHFRRGWLTPWELGRRAAHVAASDVAAMGGRVRALVLSVAAPSDFSVADLRGIVCGVRDAARGLGGALVGGNLAAASELSLTVTVLADAPARPILRSGARPGDLVCVTGRLGGAALGLRLLAGAPSMADSEAAMRCWRRPVARVQAGRAVVGVATAMIDLSDGLLVDAGRLCRASRCGVVLDVARLPLAPGLRRLDAAAARALALGGGEDYELLFTAPARRRARVERLAAEAPITVIGEVVARGGVRLVDADGRRVPAPRRRGHEHFLR